MPDRSYLKDFIGGVDPTGTATFGYGMEDAKAGNTPSAARRAVGAAGGVLGGAAVVPGLVGGIVGGIKGLAMGRGGIGGRLASAGRGALQGSHDSYSRLYRGVQAQRALGAMQAGKAVSPGQSKALSKFVSSADPTGAIAAKATPKEIAARVTELTPQHLSEARRHMGADIAAGAGALGLSGLVSGGSAYQQYNKGVEMQRAVNRQLEKQSSSIADRVLEKVASYFQNVVGFDDPASLAKLREAGADYMEDPEAVRQYHKDFYDYHRNARQAVQELAGPRPKRSPEIMAQSKSKSTDNMLTGAGIGAAVGAPIMAALARKSGLPGMLWAGGAGAGAGAGLGAIGGALASLPQAYKAQAQANSAKDDYAEREDAYNSKVKALRDQYEKDNPFQERMDVTGRARLLGGTDLGEMGKYMNIPGLNPYSSVDGYSGASTGKGYLSKQEVLDALEPWAQEGHPESDYDKATREIYSKVKASPHKFFTSTEMG